MQSGSLLLNSNSLKDLLLGVGDVRKRKIAAAKSEELVGAILKKDAVDGEKAMKRMKIRAAKKKAAKKRSLLDRSVTATGLQRARLLRQANNNIYEYALDSGLDRDSVEYLERQFGQSRSVVIECVNQLKMGFEQLSGPEASSISTSEANLLITLLGIELESKNITVDGVALPLEPTDNRTAGSLDQDSLVEPIPAGIDGPTTKQTVQNDNMVDDNSLMDVAALAPPSAQATSGAPPSVKFNKFVRVLESFIQNKLMTLHLGEMSGYAPRYATDRFLNRESVSAPQLDGMSSTLFGNTSTADLEMGGQMDDSLYDNAPGNNKNIDNNNSDNYDNRAVTFRDSHDMQNMFVSSATLHRPTSAGGEYSAHNTTSMSTMPRIRVENDSNVYSQSEKDILPPLRLGRNLRKQRKELGLTLGKKHFTKAGFDASFTRSTPRVLQGKPASKDIQHGGGATQAEIDALRWELTVAREGIKHLDKMVDTNIAWVQTNCDMSSMAGNFSSRTKQKCRNMATERIVAVYAGLVDNTLYWALRRWQTAVRYDRLFVTVKKFSKLKAVELLTNTLWDVAARQMYYRGWQPWLRFVQAQILHKMNAAAVQIQRIARGRLGRVKFNKVKLGQVALTLQKLFRKVKAVSVLKEKRFVREQELSRVALKAIQKFLASLIRIRLAKAEAKRLREHRASVHIQKIHRGRAGRKEFLQNFLKKQHAAEELAEKTRKAHTGAGGGGGDLENLAAHASSVGAELSAVHNTHKRSLFTAEIKDDVGSRNSPATSPKARLKSAPSKKGDNSPQRGARRSLDGVLGQRPQTPDAESPAAMVTTATAKGSGGSGVHGRGASSRSPLHSATKPKHSRASSPNPSTTAAARAGHSGNKASPAHGKSHPVHAPASTTGGGHGHPHDGPITHRKSLTGKVPSNPSTPAASRPPSAIRNATAAAAAAAATPSKTSPGNNEGATPSSVLVGEKQSPDASSVLRTSASAPAPAEPPTVESMAQSEKLHAESNDDDVISSEAMIMMLQRQNSAKKIQGLIKTKTKTQRTPSLDSNEPTDPATRGKIAAKPSAKPTRVANATNSRSKSTRAGPLKRSGDSSNPAEAVTSIQKLARGKLARALSKKLIEEKELGEGGNTDSSAPGGDTTEGDVDNSAYDVAAVGADDGLSVSAASGGASVGVLEGDGALDDEPEVEQERDRIAPMPTRPAPLNITTQPSQSSQLSLSRDSSVSHQSKPSTPLGALLSSGSSLLNSLRLPGFSSSSRQPSPDHTPAAGATGAAVGGVAAAEERPRSSTFFRNPFSGWSSRGSSRENTPVKQRPATTGAEKDREDSFFTFHRPEPIFEKPEVDPVDTAQKDEEQSCEEHVHEEQTGELPISEKQQVSEEPEHASVAGVLSELQRAEEAAEHISALVSGLLPPSADGPRTPKSSANTSTVSKLSKTATSPAISSAPLPAETMTPKPGSANAPNRPNAVVRRSSVNKDKPGSGGGLRRSSFDREDKRSPLRRSSFDREDKGSTSRRSSFDREGGGRISPSTPKDSDRSTPRSRNRASFDKEGEKGSGALRRSSFDRSGGSTHQSGARSMHVSGSANAHQQGGKVGSASVRQPASRRTTAPGSTLNAPAASAVASTTTTAAVPVPVPECVPSIPEVSSLSLLEEQEDQLAPLPANFAFGDVDHSETPDASGISGADFSLPPGFADASTISEGNEYSDMSGFDNPENAKPSSSSSDKEKRASSSKNKAATSVTSSVASSASASAAEKERVKKEKEDHAKAVKDKANQKKKDAEDKRKADAAKAKAARDERENSKHETSKTRQPAGASKTDKSETSRHVKPAPPRKLDSKSNSAGSKVGDSTAAAGGDGEEGDDQHSELPSRVASHDAGATTPKGMSPSPRSNPPTPKVPKSGTTFAKPNIDPEAAALKIQKRARVKVSAKKVQEKKEEIISAQKKLGMLIHWAVVTIQRNFRGRKGRKKFISQQMAKQVELAQKKEKSAQLIQSRARGIVGRKKANFIKAKVRQEKQEIEWMESYQKDGGKKINLKVEGASRAPADIQKDSPSKQDSFQGSLSTRSAKVATSSKSLKTPDKEQDKVGLEEEGEGPAPAAAAIVDVISPAAIHAAQQAEEMNERIRKLEEIERTIREKEEKMAEYARKAEEQAQAMQNALLQMQEQAKKQEDDRLAQQQLLAMAAGPMSHRSDYASPFSTQQRRAMGTGGGHGNSTMPMSSRRSVPNSARHPDAPPTARSARGGAAIPPDAPHVTYNGEDWVQLWDPDEAAYYWYCERTQFAQWDEPGAANNQSSVTIVANYLQNVNEGDDSGYESAGALTDWSTDHDGQSAYTSDSEYESSVWQEFWDESAQAKYWYNNNTGEASWTRPESAALSMGGSEDGSQQLAITNGGYEDNSAAGSANEWVSYIDEDTEQAYWYNVRTGETSWA